MNVNEFGCIPKRTTRSMNEHRLCALALILECIGMRLSTEAVKLLLSVLFTYYVYLWFLVPLCSM